MNLDLLIEAKQSFYSISFISIMLIVLLNILYWKYRSFVLYLFLNGMILNYLIISMIFLHNDRFETLKSNNQAVKESFFTAEQFTNLDKEAQNAMIYCLDLEVSEYRRTMSLKESSEKCSVKNKNIIFANLNEQNFEKLQNKNLEYKLLVFKIEFFIDLLANKMINTESINDLNNINQYLSTSFKPIKPYVEKVAVSRLNSEITSLDLTTKSGLDKFKVLISKTKHECFAFDSKNCDIIKKSLIEVKTKFENYNHNEDFKSVTLDF